MNVRRYDAALGLATSITLHASRMGPDAVTELLLDAVAAEFATNRRDQDTKQEIRDLRNLISEIRTNAIAVPMPGRILAMVIEATLADLPPLDAMDSSLFRRMIVKNCRRAATELRQFRQATADFAALTIGPNRTICFYGLGDRHKDLGAALAARYGRRGRILVCNRTGISMGNDDALISEDAHELLVHLKATIDRSDLPSVETVHLRDAALAASQSDYLFILVCGLRSSGDLIVPPGAESVYHSALAFGKDVGVLVNSDDVALPNVVPLDATAYTVLTASPNVRAFVGDGECHSADLAKIATKISAFDAVGSRGR